jgi:regulatory protein
MNLALYYLEQRARSEKELRDYLSRKEMPEEIIDDVIERLAGYGYIDDGAFAARYAATRIRRNSGRKIAYELRRKGVGDDAVRQALGSIDPDEELQGAMEHARRSLKGETDQKARQRAYASLARRGYPGELVRKALDALLKDQDFDQDFMSTNEEDDA